MYRLWSEYAIGEGKLVFASLEAGEAWLASNTEIARLAAGERQTVDEYLYNSFNDWGHLAWETLEVIH